MQHHIFYTVAILLVRKLSVRGRLKTKTAPSREFAHEQNSRAVQSIHDILLPDN